MKKMVWSLIITSMMILVAACDSDSNTPVSIATQANAEAVSPASTDSGAPGASSQGNAEFTFSGPIEATFTGDAMHMIQETPGGDVFMLNLYSYQDENNFTAITIVNMNGAGNLGEFTLDDDSDYKVGFLHNVAGAMSVGGLNTGHLVLNSGGNSSLQGTLNFSGFFVTGPDSENENPLTVEATFMAMAGTINDLPKGLGAQ